MRDIVPGIGCFKTPEELFASERLSVVHIITPPATHASLAKLALKAGCHIYVEKPFTESVEDALQILDDASAKVPGKKKILHGCFFMAVHGFMAMAAPWLMALALALAMALAMAMAQLQVYPLKSDCGSSGGMDHYLPITCEAPPSVPSALVHPASISCLRPIGRPGSY